MKMWTLDDISYNIKCAGTKDGELFERSENAAGGLTLKQIRWEDCQRHLKKIVYIYVKSLPTSQPGVAHPSTPWIQ